jgi:hypothetical protein
MAHTLTVLERATGRLVFAIQREWTAEAGGPCAAECEDAMRSAQRLLLSARGGSLVPLIGVGSVTRYIGRKWIAAHPWVWPHVQVLESVLLREEA